MPGPGSSDARMRKATATTGVSPVIGNTGRPNEGETTDDVLRMIGTAFQAVRHADMIFLECHNIDDEPTLRN